MKLLNTVCLASALTVAMSACTKPAETTPADAAPAVAVGEPSPAASSMPEPAGVGGMKNTLSVTYECAQGGDLKVNYAGVADLSTSTASLNVDGVAVQLPRKGSVWDNGTYMLKGDDEVNLSKAGVFVFQHATEKVNGVDTQVDKILMKDCVAQNATP